MNREWIGNLKDIELEKNVLSRFELGGLHCTLHDRNNTVTTLNFSLCLPSPRSYLQSTNVHPNTVTTHCYCSTINLKVCRPGRWGHSRNSHCHTTGSTAVFSLHHSVPSAPLRKEIQEKNTTEDIWKSEVHQECLLPTYSIQGGKDRYCKER